MTLAAAVISYYCQPGKPSTFSAACGLLWATKGDIQACKQGIFRKYRERNLMSLIEAEPS